MKKIVMVTMILIVALGLVACQNDRDDVFRVGLEAAYAPFNWTTTTESEFTHPIHGQPNMFADGYDVQIARMMAEEMGKTLEIHSITWLGLIPALITNQIDAIIAGMTATDARREQIDFTNTYWTSEVTILVRENTTFAEATSLEDLSGARVVSQAGTIYDTMYNQIPNATRLAPLNNYGQLALQLQTGNADVVIGEYPVIALAAAQSAGLTYVRFAEGNGFTPHFAPVAIGVRQNDQDTRDSMNNVLARLSEADRYEIMDAAIARHTPVATTSTQLVYVGVEFKSEDYV